MLLKILSFVIPFLFFLIGTFPTITGSGLSSELSMRGDFKTFKERGFDIQKGLDFEATRDSFRAITIRITYQNKVSNFKDASVFINSDYSGVFLREIITRSILSAIFTFSLLVASNSFGNYSNADKRLIFVVSCVFCGFASAYLLLERSIFVPIFYKSTREFFAPLEVNPPGYLNLIFFFFVVVYFAFVFEKTKESRLPINKRSPT